jgi:putative transposase
MVKKSARRTRRTHTPAFKARVKYERVYLMAYDSVATARANIAQYFDWYNTERPHSSLDRTTPDTVYQELLPKQVAAA